MPKEIGFAELWRSLGITYGSAEYHRLYYAYNKEHLREKHREFNKKYYIERPVQEYARRQRYRDKYPVKAMCHEIVRRATYSKRLSKLPCETCGLLSPVVAHHDDYSKPLSIRWFCEPHHKLWHKTSKFIRKEPLTQQEVDNVMSIINLQTYKEIVS